MSDICASTQQDPTWLIIHSKLAIKLVPIPRHSKTLAPRKSDGNSKCRESLLLIYTPMHRSLLLARSRLFRSFNLAGYCTK